ncbi:hypothetical protein NU10_05200 [Flavobacterium dauae]|uniref:hypothetical protein n=1 Tax=Flavobacterium dauae TaxID=1563479 RepID=UPI00101B2CE4|nr:hypothetical protein [Flavobacterium dauae]WLD24777.1 hypothetical protein NU10_05200 [Flavobacterium dauae]
MNEVAIQPTNIITDKSKYRLLFLSVLFDFIGTLSFAIPLLGEFSDVVWAPVSALLLKIMYKGKTGTIGGIVSFIEEALPGLDFIPTFTLTWIYTYVIKKK